MVRDFLHYHYYYYEYYMNSWGLLVIVKLLIQFSSLPIFVIDRILNHKMSVWKSIFRNQKLTLMSSAGNGCCCTSKAFWMPLLVNNFHHHLMQELLLFRMQDFVASLMSYDYHFLCFLWLAFWSWDLASALKESKERFDSAGVKLIAVGVGTPDKARILAERVFFLPLTVKWTLPEEVYVFN